MEHGSAEKVYKWNSTGRIAKNLIDNLSDDSVNEYSSDSDGS